MKRLSIIIAATSMSFILGGCGTVNDTANFATSTVGTGVKYTGQTIGSGIGFIGDTGANVGRGVTGLFGGNTTYNKVGYTRGQTVLYKGHRYVLHNGKYVRIN